jgi:predicted nucleic acid-binding protein
MSSFVLDCSIAASWCFEDEASPDIDALLERTRDHGAVVPALWHWEIANVLAMAARRGRIAAGDATARLSLIGALPIATDTDSIARAWREALLLAQTHGLTVYDAAYLELAVRLGVPLATKDSDLQAAARQVGVTTIP